MQTEKSPHQQPPLSAFLHHNQPSPSISSKPPPPSHLHHLAPPPPFAARCSLESLEVRGGRQVKGLCGGAFSRRGDWGGGGGLGGRRWWAVARDRVWEIPVGCVLGIVGIVNIGVLTFCLGGLRIWDVLRSISNGSSFGCVWILDSLSEKKKETRDSKLCALVWLGKKMRRKGVGISQEIKLSC